MISAQSNYCRRAFRPCFHRGASLFCAMVICGVVRVNAVPPSVMVVDIIPEEMSGETDANIEPDLAVNPSNPDNPSQMAAFASFSDPIGGNVSWILVSTDGG